MSKPLISKIKKLVTDGGGKVVFPTHLTLPFIDAIVSIRYDSGCNYYIVEHPDGKEAIWDYENWNTDGLISLTRMLESIVPQYIKVQGIPEGQDPLVKDDEYFEAKLVAIHDELLTEIHKRIASWPEGVHVNNLLFKVKGDN